MNANVTTRLALALAVATLAVGSLAAAPAEPTGLEVMRRTDERDTGRTSRYTVSMTLLSKAGAKRQREVIAYSKDYGDAKKTVMAFRTPKDVAGVGYLTWDYDEKGKDDDMWLFMPALKKVRRVTGSSRNDDFMGTDFTYEDMGSRDLDKDDFSLSGSETVGGADCWVVVAVPKGADPYSRRVLRVRKDDYVIAGAEYYDRQGKLLRLLSVPVIERVDGVWTAMRMEMKNVQDGHSTVIEMSDVRYNLEIDDELFTVAAIERGRVR